MITCTGLEDFVNNRFPLDRIFKVEDGTVIQENETGTISGTDSSTDM